jgi:drug/metabolite transporter (DMT)-like permease
MRALPTWQLFATAVAIWSTTWYAILYQLAYTPPELGVALRFALAGLLALAFARWRGDAVRCTVREHARLALQGSFMYALSYLCIYHAERHVPSGLVAVGFSVSPLVAGIGARLLWQTALGARFVVGGVLCVVGVALIFAPELAHVATGPAAATGALYIVGAVLLSAVGCLMASRNNVHRLAFWPALGWGMFYGALVAAGVMFAGNHAVMPPSPLAAPSWWLSLAYLAMAGSVVAFACFLELQQRVGPGAASTVGVMTPMAALALSAAFEGFVPVAPTWLGVALAVAGNVLILRPQLRRAGAAAP